MLFGSFIVVLVPPFQSPDAPTHFYRIFQISEGGLVSERRGNLWGGEIPASLPEVTTVFMRALPFSPENKQNGQEILEWLNQPLDPDQRIFRSFPNSAYSSPVAYLPQVLAVALGRWVQASPLALMYLGRLGNLLMGSLLIMLAIKLTPVHKEVFYLLGLMPMTLFLRGTLSADAATTGLAFLLTALILKEVHGGEKSLGWPSLALIAFVAAMAVQCKTIYVFLPFLFFAIPASRGNDSRNYWKGAGLVLGGALSSWLAWSRIISKLYVPCNPRVAADMMEPIKFILADPVRFLGMIVENHIAHAGDYLVSFVGVLGWWDTKLPLAQVVAYAVALGVAAACCYGPGGPSVRTRLIAGTITLLSAALLAASQYIVWNAPGSLQIDMMQGRYFIPFAPIGFLAIAGRCRLSPSSQLRIRGVLELFAVASLVVAAAVIYRRYYVG